MTKHLKTMEFLPSPIPELRSLFRIGLSIFFKGVDGKTIIDHIKNSGGKEVQYNLSGELARISFFTEPQNRALVFKLPFTLPDFTNQIYCVLKINKGIAVGKPQAWLKTALGLAEIEIWEEATFFHFREPLNFKEGTIEIYFKVLMALSDGSLKPSYGKIRLQRAQSSQEIIARLEKNDREEIVDEVQRIANGRKTQSDNPKTLAQIRRHNEQIRRDNPQFVLTSR